MMVPVMMKISLHLVLFFQLSLFQRKRNRRDTYVNITGNDHGAKNAVVQEGVNMVSKSDTASLVEGLHIACTAREKVAAKNVEDQNSVNMADK